MKAMLVHGPRDLRAAEWPVPEPGPGEALVRVKACGICGSDIHSYEHGEIGGTAIEAPLVLGHELAGEVVALGPGVTGLAVGTPVAVDPAMPCGRCEFCLEGDPHVCPQMRFFGNYPYHGGFREYLAHPADLLFPLPEGLTYTDGALVEPMGIALYVAELAGMRLGDRVAVLGAGPIGLLCIDMMRLSGAVDIVATDLVDARLEAARRLGATEAWNAAREDVVGRIMDHTAGRGADVVIEAAGVPETVEQAMEVAKPGGTVVLVGIPDDDRISFKASTSRRKGLTIKYDRRMKHTYPRCLALVKAGRVDLRPLATHHFPLERLGEALDTVRTRADGVLKAIVEI